MRADARYSHWPWNSDRNNRYRPSFESGSISQFQEIIGKPGSQETRTMRVVLVYPYDAFLITSNNRHLLVSKEEIATCHTNAADIFGK